MYPAKISFNTKTTGAFRLAWFSGCTENAATRINGEMFRLRGAGQVVIRCPVPERPRHETNMNEFLVYTSDLTPIPAGFVGGSNGFCRFLFPENTQLRLFFQVETLNGHEIEVDDVSIEWGDL
jgi:hypothetical protein